MNEALLNIAYGVVGSLIAAAIWAMGVSMYRSFKKTHSDLTSPKFYDRMNDLPEMEVTSPNFFFEKQNQHSQMIEAAKWF